MNIKNVYILILFNFSITNNPFVENKTHKITNKILSIEKKHEIKVMKDVKRLFYKRKRINNFVRLFSVKNKIQKITNKILSIEKKNEIKVIKELKPLFYKKKTISNFFKLFLSQKQISNLQINKLVNGLNFVTNIMGKIIFFYLKQIFSWKFFIMGLLTFFGAYSLREILFFDDSKSENFYKDKNRKPKYKLIFFNVDRLRLYEGFFIENDKNPFNSFIDTNKEHVLYSGFYCFNEKYIEGKNTLKPEFYEDFFANQKPFYKIIPINKTKLFLLKLGCVIFSVICLYFIFSKSTEPFFYKHYSRKMITNILSQQPTYKLNSFSLLEIQNIQDSIDNFIDFSQNIVQKFFSLSSGIPFSFLLMLTVPFYKTVFIFLFNLSVVIILFYVYMNSIFLHHKKVFNYSHNKNKVNHLQTEYLNNFHLFKGYDTFEKANNNIQKVVKNNIIQSLFFKEKIKNTKFTVIFSFLYFLVMYFSFRFLFNQVDNGYYYFNTDPTPEHLKKNNGKVSYLSNFLQGKFFNLIIRSKYSPVIINIDDFFIIRFFLWIFNKESLDDIITQGEESLRLGPTISISVFGIGIICIMILSLFSIFKPIIFIYDIHDFFGEFLDLFNYGIKLVEIFKKFPLYYRKSSKNINNFVSLGEIIVKDLTVKEIPIFNKHPINTTIEKNKLTFIIGSTGSGKSSFAESLVLIKNPKKGSLFLTSEQNGEIKEYDIKTLSNRDLSQSIIYINQNPSIFNNTLANNINLYRKGFDQEMVQIILNLGLENTIKNKIINLKNKKNPNFNTEDFNNQWSNIEERKQIIFHHLYLIMVDDTTLSGGEKQRVNIARALLFIKSLSEGSKPIILLDEFTANLDPKTAELIEEIFLNQLIALNCTVVCITHSPKQFHKYAQKVLVFDNGALVEQGSYDDLKHNTNSHMNRIMGSNGNLIH